MIMDVRIRRHRPRAGLRRRSDDDPRVRLRRLGCSWFRFGVCALGSRYAGAPQPEEVCKPCAVLLAEAVSLPEGFREIWAGASGFRVPPRLATNAPQQRAAAVAADLAYCLLPSAAGSPLEVPGDLVRLSVGIEDVEDLLADLAHALA